MKFNKLLIEKEITVLELSTLADLGLQTIRDLANEKTQLKNAKLETAKKIADVLKMSLDELYSSIDPIDEVQKERTLSDLKDLLNTRGEIIIESDWEYSLLVGQLAYYMQIHSKVPKTQAYINKFLDCNTQKNINNVLQERFKIARTKSKRFNYIFSLVLEYDNLKKIEPGAIVAGYLGENIVTLDKKK